LRIGIELRRIERRSYFAIRSSDFTANSMLLV
jgi:hypothetical protein